MSNIDPFPHYCGYKLRNWVVLDITKKKSPFMSGTFASILRYAHAFKTIVYKGITDNANAHGISYVFYLIMLELTRCFYVFLMLSWDFPGSTLSLPKGKAVHLPHSRGVHQHG